MTVVIEYPFLPGSKEPTTSAEAAAAIAPKASTLRGKVLELLRLCRLTADEAADLLHESVLYVRPRVTELYRMGLIARTGERRRNASGMRAHVYTAL